MTKSERERTLNGWFKRPILGRITAILMLATLPVSILLVSLIMFVFSGEVKETVSNLLEIARWDDKERADG